MNKITPLLWFGDNTEEAIDFYTEVFKDSELNFLQKYPEHEPELGGKVMMAEFRLFNQNFRAFDAGPLFEYTPATSFYVELNTIEEVKEYWKKLIEGGEALIELDRYDFSDSYGWLEDKYGISWQLTLSERNQITPSLMFVDDQFGRAEDAMELYLKVFPKPKKITVNKFPEDDEENAGAMMFASFSIAKQDMIVMDGIGDHGFSFNEAISFFVDCNNQDEVDEYWDSLIADGGEESMCGWLKDKFGVSWQIVPKQLGEYLADKDREKADRVMQAMLKMKRIVVKELQAAYENNPE